MRKIQRQIWGFLFFSGILLAACHAPVTFSDPFLKVQTLSSGLDLNWVEGSEIPSEHLKSIHNKAQSYADDISRRRKIDFFNLHNYPVGWSLGSDSYLLFFLGTSQKQRDLNLELRALVSGKSLDLNLNFSGPVTWQASAATATPAQNKKSTSETDYHYELLLGLPGNGVTETYGVALEELGVHLQRRYQARPFTFDDAPLVYAIHKNAQLQGFVFMNQGNKLILGERKYADVQSMIVLSPQAHILGQLTLVGFNPKTDTSTSPPQFRALPDTATYGTILEFGLL